ncbi:putative RecQ mediated genome instability protein [Rosa chinensis]|uniref:Putative RecQ mediated genome instability protein n=1 Tax=Rosa chinensis TaxID=74649 RepID=A0A2P6RJ93_ROSCH|nr:putative RecQ mediated genome instability protein [Rosa chinensis]
MEESSGALSDAAIETLRSRGWYFGGDLEQVQAMILIHSALADDTRTVVNSVESELLNMDLKSVGAKSLPDPATLRKSSHLLGPKIAWVRDITSSNVDDFARNSSRRLLKLGLSDGHGEVAAIEYLHIPSFSDDVVPGTKVRLENKAIIRNGIVCLTPKVLTVLGGVVQSLYEEWQMNKKYSGFSRSTLRLSKESDGNGPPPFEKLQVGAPKTQFPRQDKSYQSDVNTKSSDPTIRSSEIRPSGKQQQILLSKSNGIDNPNKKNDLDVNLKTDSVNERTEEKPSSSATRPKEVVEAVPVQNQAAAQKLLQKMSHQNQDSRHSRGRKFRGKGREEESEVFTLEEWEKRKAGAKPSITATSAVVHRDEELAWRLQNQFDLEDSHAQMGPQNVEAEDIKLSMFKYEKNDDWGSGMGNERRGRGRGRGRGKGRGRGRRDDDGEGYGMEHGRSGSGRGWGRRDDDGGGSGMEHGRSGSGRGWGRRDDDSGGSGMEHGRSGSGRGRDDDSGGYGMEHGRSGSGRGRDDDSGGYGMEHGRSGSGRGRDDDSGGYGMEHGRSGSGRGRGRWSRGR